MERNENEQTRAGQGTDGAGSPAENQTRQAPPAAGAGGLSASEIEGLETDGKGTGGVGQDLGGAGPVPGSEASG
jgi:hypothetical protein